MRQATVSGMVAFRYLGSTDAITGVRTQASSTARGYGQAHRKLRAWWLTKVERGEVHCWRCGKWISPAEPWDLGHDDLDRREYRGPEHWKCNRSTSTRAAERRAAAKPTGQWSYQWADLDDNE
jgi:hypothetical protein